MLVFGSMNDSMNQVHAGLKKNALFYLNFNQTSKNIAIPSRPTCSMLIAGMERQ